MVRLQDFDQKFDHTLKLGIDRWWHFNVGRERLLPEPEQDLEGSFMIGGREFEEHAVVAYVFIDTAPHSFSRGLLPATVCVELRILHSNIQ